MRLFVGVTDFDWYTFLAARPQLDEVNFWQPSGGVGFKALAPGEIFLFKLHSPRNYIVGGGIFAHWSQFPVSLAWEAFGEKNGVDSLTEMRRRLARYRRASGDPRNDYSIGCIMLEQPFFLDERDWIAAPADWSRNIVRGKGYVSTEAEGTRLWEALESTVPLAAAGMAAAVHEPQAVFETRSDQPTLVYPRLGQGSFRLLVTDLYQRRCVVTGERTLPVLQASHIKSIEAGGPHDPRNGLLLRSDLHTLFDRGYVTVTPDLNFEVGRRIKDEFKNGRDYYALHGRRLAAPSNPVCVPSREYLEWHSAHVFSGK
jgi:putative restriction endonuclease